MLKPDSVAAVAAKTGLSKGKAAKALKTGVNSNP